MEVAPRTRSATSVTVVVPALNEERNIGWLLAQAAGRRRRGHRRRRPLDRRHGRASRCDAPGRRDRRTSDRPARAPRCAPASPRATGDVIVMIDADGSMDPAEISRYVDAIDEGYDLVKGSRFLEDGGTTDLSRLRSVGNLALLGVANVMYGSSFTELCYGYMAFRRDALAAAAAVGATASRSRRRSSPTPCAPGCGSAEVPSFESARRSGESNLRHVPRRQPRAARAACGRALHVAARARPRPRRLARAERRRARCRPLRPVAAPSVLRRDLRLRGRARGAARSPPSRRCARRRSRPHEVIVVDRPQPRRCSLGARGARPSARSIPNRRARAGCRARATPGSPRRTGDVVAFLDDDAVAAPDWLERLAGGLRRSGRRRRRRRRAAGVGRRGGRAGSPRSSTGSSAAATAACPSDAAPVRNLIGCNMSFRRERRSTRVGGFSARLGRVGAPPARLRGDRAVHPPRARRARRR